MSRRRSGVERQVAWRVLAGADRGYPLDRRYPLAPWEGGEVVDGEWREVPVPSGGRGGGVGDAIGWALVVVTAAAMLYWVVTQGLPWLLVGLAALPGAALVVGVFVWFILKVVIGPVGRC